MIESLQCTTDRHIFAAALEADREPPSECRCQCGAWQWGDMQTAGGDKANE